MTEHPTRSGIYLRLVLAGLLVVAGLVATSHLRWTLSGMSSPHAVLITLQLPGSTPPGEVGRRWLGAIEAAAQGVPGAVEVRAEGLRSAGHVRVALAPGSEPEAAAERLDIALRPLAATLPEGSRLAVSPEGESGPVTWSCFLPEVPSLFDRSGADPDPVSATAAWHSIANSMATVPGVRSVEVQPHWRQDVVVHLRPGMDDVAHEARAGLAGAFSPRSVDSGLLRLARQSDPSPSRLAELSEALDPRALAYALANLRVSAAGGAVALSDVAEISSRSRLAEPQVRVDGAAGTLLVVRRFADAPPLALASNLRALLPPTVRGTVLTDESIAWRGVANRLAIAILLFLVTASRLAARSWREASRIAARAGLMLLVGSAGLAIAMVAFDWPLAPDTAAIACFALALSLALAGPFAHRRSLALAAVPPLAVLAMLVTLHALDGQLEDRLRPTLQIFTAALLASSLTANLLRDRAQRQPSARVGRRILRSTVRGPATAILFFVSLAGATWLLAGSTLSPVEGAPLAATSDVDVALDLPAGGTLEDALARTLVLERALRRVEGIERIQSTVRATRVDLAVWAVSRDQRGDRAARFVERLRRALPFGVVSPRALDRGQPMGELLDALNDPDGESARPFSPWTAESYTVTISAQSGAALHEAVDTIRARIYSLGRPRSIDTGWGAVTTRLVLNPLVTATAASGHFGPQQAALAAALHERSTPASPIALAGDFDVLLASSGQPIDEAAVPQRTALLETPLSPALPIAATELATLDSELEAERLPRRAGRFELPMTLKLPGSNERVRRAWRESIDNALASLHLPGGSSLARPNLGRYRIELRTLKLALGALTTLLAWCLIAARFAGDSGRRTPLLLLPSIAALTATAIVLALTGAAADERQWMAAALASLPGMTLAAAIFSQSAHPRSFSLHRGAARLLPVAAALLAASAALALATAGASPAREPWAPALTTAAIASAAATLCGVLLVPALAGRRAKRVLFQAVAVPVTGAPIEITASTATSLAASPALALTARRLVKTYPGGFRALDRVSFTLSPGITGLLGPNGAGKTTLLRMLVGLLEPTRGQIRLSGPRFDAPLNADTMDAYRRRLGFLPQDFNAYPGFTAEEFLHHWIQTRELELPQGADAEVDRLLQAIGLGEHRARRVRDFSGGMRRRLGIAVAMLGAPDLVIVDEPTTGLDLPSRQRLREILLAAAGERILLLSTHIASDVEAIASRLLVLRSGRLVFDGPVSDLIARARGRVHETVLRDDALLAFSHRHQVTRRVRELDGVRVRSVSNQDNPAPGLEVEPNLEEAYLAAMRP
ncbi:MAG: ATP-binding cassette domain-containing protein [Acidobacteriota bacterium]